MIAVLGLILSVFTSSAQGLTDGQRQALEVLNGGTLVSAESEVVNIGGREHTVVFLAETHIMDPDSNARLQAVLSNFKLRGLEGYVCDNWICKGVGFLYMNLLSLAQQLNLGSSILQARIEGWFFTATGQVGYNGFLIGRTRGAGFEFRKNFIESMAPDDADRFLKFAYGMRQMQMRVDPNVVSPDEFDPSTIPFDPPPVFDGSLPINIELEYGLTNSFDNCRSGSWLLWGRNCRMATNIWEFLTEFPETPVLLLQMGSYHVDDVRRILRAKQGK